MNQVSCNCIVCAQEFNSGELKNLTLSEINKTNFKVCQSCFNSSDPSEDYREVRSIVEWYLNTSEAKNSYNEVKLILNKIN